MRRLPPAPDREDVIVLLTLTVAANDGTGQSGDTDATECSEKGQ